MSSFDPERFEDKYEHYFTELQQAYRAAFEEMTERYDSGLIHAIDQQILAESEPFYETSDDGGFHISVPDDPARRLPDRNPDHLQRVLEEYTAEIDRQLREVFDLEA